MRIVEGKSEVKVFTASEDEERPAQEPYLSTGRKVCSREAPTNQCQSGHAPTDHHEPDKYLRAVSQIEARVLINSGIQYSVRG